MSERNRIVAALWLSLIMCGTAVGTEQPSLTPEKIAAVDRAKRELSQKIAVAPEQLALVAIEAKQWPDSSLGCAKPGSMYQQVITPGYVVVLSSGESTHEVHVAREHAVLCAREGAEGLRPQQPRVRATQLPKLEQSAREDLAKRLGVALEDVRVVKRVPKQWTAEALECKGSESVQSTNLIPGFKLYLSADRRTFTYHTDGSRVIACPAIESR